MGEWRNNVKNGKGTYSYNDGDRYEGEWKDDARSGTGKFFNTALGTTHYAEGGKYEGQYIDDMKSGKGKMEFPNGDVYDGNWEYNEIQGEGSLWFYC